MQYNKSVGNIGKGKGERTSMKHWRSILIALLAAVLLVSATVPAMADSVKAKVTSSSAKIYRKASSKSGHVKIKKGTQVTVTAVKGNWAKVKISGKTGYVPVKYLSKTSSGSSSTSWKRKVVKMKWFSGGSGVLATGRYGTIYGYGRDGAHQAHGRT